MASAAAVGEEGVASDFSALLAELDGVHAQQQASSHADPLHDPLLDQLREVAAAPYLWEGHTPSQINSDGVHSTKNIDRDAFNAIVFKIRRAIGGVLTEGTPAMAIRGKQAGFNTSGGMSNIWIQMCVDMFMKMAMGHDEYVDAFKKLFSVTPFTAMTVDIRINLEKTATFFELAPKLAERGPAADGMQSQLEACFQPARGGKGKTPKELTEARVEKVTSIFEIFHGHPEHHALYGDLCKAVGAVFKPWSEGTTKVRTRQAIIYREGRLHRGQEKFTHEWFETYYQAWDAKDPVRPRVTEAARRKVTAVVEVAVAGAAEGGADGGGHEEDDEGGGGGAAAAGGGRKEDDEDDEGGGGVSRDKGKGRARRTPEHLAKPLPVVVTTMFHAGDRALPEDSDWQDSFVPVDDERELVYYTGDAKPEKAQSAVIDIIPGARMASGHDGVKTPVAKSPIPAIVVASPIRPAGPQPFLSMGSPVLSPAVPAHRPPSGQNTSSSFSGSLFDVEFGSLTMNSLSQYESDVEEFRKDNWEEQERLIFAMHWFLDEASELLGGALPPAPDVTMGGEGENVVNTLKMLLEQAYLLREMIRVASVHERYCKVYYNELRVKAEEYKRMTYVDERQIIAGWFKYSMAEADIGDEPLDKSNRPDYLRDLSPEQCYCRSYYVRGMWQRSRVLLEYAAHMLTGIVNGMQYVSDALQSESPRERIGNLQKLKFFTAPTRAKLHYAENARPSETVVEAFKENVQTIYGISKSIMRRGDALHDKQCLDVLNGNVSPRLLYETYLRLQHNYGELYSKDPTSIVRTVVHTVQNAMEYDTKYADQNDSEAHDVLDGLARKVPNPLVTLLVARVESDSDSDSDSGPDPDPGLRPVHRATRPLQLQPLYRRFHSSLKF